MRTTERMHMVAVMVLIHQLIPIVKHMLGVSVDK